MKFWNKRKSVRLRCWTCVKLKLNNSPLYANYQGWLEWTQYDKFKIELQRMPRKGKFYVEISKKEVWFENGKDATWFALKHSEILA